MWLSKRSNKLDDFRQLTLSLTKSGLDRLLQRIQRQIMQKFWVVLKLLPAYLKVRNLPHIKEDNIDVLHNRIFTSSLKCNVGL